MEHSTEPVGQTFQALRLTLPSHSIRAHLTDSLFLKAEATGDSTGRGIDNLSPQLLAVSQGWPSVLGEVTSKGRQKANTRLPG